MRIHSHITHTHTQTHNRIARCTHDGATWHPILAPDREEVHVRVIEPGSWATRSGNARRMCAEQGCMQYVYGWSHDPLICMRTQNILAMIDLRMHQACEDEMRFLGLSYSAQR